MEPQTKERLTLAAAGAALALVLAGGSWVGTFRPWATEGPEASRSAPGIRATGVDKPFEVELGELRRMACGLVNATDRTLEIASISTGCACRTASFRPSTLEPGEKADVEIVYDSSHGTARDLKFPIVVTCGDGETIKADKEISIHHEQSIRLQGAPLDLGEVPVLSNASGEFAIAIPAGDRIKGVSASTGIEGLQVSVASDPAAPGFHTIHCDLASPEAAGEIQGTVRVEVAGYRGRDVVYEVPVRGTVAGSVTIHPPSGFVGMLTPGKTKTLRFDIAARGEPRSVAIDRVEAPAWAGASHACFAGHSAVVLDVTFNPSEAPDDLRQFDLELSGTVDGKPFSAVIPCVAVAIKAGS
jgi:hypothetical protein